MVFLFILTIVCVLLLYYLKLNRGQMNAHIVYQYKFIPAPIAKYVDVVKLKTNE